MADSARASPSRRRLGERLAYSPSSRRRLGERLAYSPSSRRRLGETPNRLAERVGGDPARGSPSRLEVAADSVGTRPESTGLRVATGLWEGIFLHLALVVLQLPFWGELPLDGEYAG